MRPSIIKMDLNFISHSSKIALLKEKSQMYGEYING